MEQIGDKSKIALEIAKKSNLPPFELWIVFSHNSL